MLYTCLQPYAFSLDLIRPFFYLSVPNHSHFLRIKQQVLFMQTRLPVRSAFYGIHLVILLHPSWIWIHWWTAQLHYIMMPSHHSSVCHPSIHPSTIRFWTALLMCGQSSVSLLVGQFMYKLQNTESCGHKDNQTGAITQLSTSWVHIHPPTILGWQFAASCGWWLEEWDHARRQL